MNALRIWDQVPPTDLCRQHLLAQWREGLGLWNVLTQEKKGYRAHPETKRWEGRLAPLYDLLARTRDAMLARGWDPKPLPEPPRADEGTGAGGEPPPPWDDQLGALRAKACACRVPPDDRGPSRRH